MEKQMEYEKARTEMVSGISHDLRTPLTSIKGYIKGMLDGVANTEKIAKTIVEITGAETYKIEPEIPYTSDDLNYNDDSCRANKEMQDSSARPKITGSVKDIEKYKTIYLGYPIWWGTAPKIINTFIETYNTSLKGKKIVMFCTSGSSDISKSNEELKSTYPDINWISGKRFEAGASKSEIEDWMKGLN